jgi:hypothetical protein
VKSVVQSTRWERIKCRYSLRTGKVEGTAVGGQTHHAVLLEGTPSVQTLNHPRTVERLYRLRLYGRLPVVYSEYRALISPQVVFSTGVARQGQEALALIIARPPGAYKTLKLQSTISI